MQRLLIASGIYPPDIGGPATYSQLIAREFTKRGVNVSVICYSDKKQDDNENFKIVRILRKNKLSRYLSYFWNLLKLARNCDVIYAQGPLAAGLPAMWVSKILKKKFVIKIVGDYAWEQYQNQESRIKNQKYKFEDIETFHIRKHDFKTETRKKIQKLVCQRANRIVVPSEFLKKIVKGWEITENKIVVIYNAFSGTGDVGPKELGGDVIISAGRPEPWKGYNTLNEIMPDLLKENPEFKLIVLTKASHHELIEHFKSSEVFVLNSGYEGFSHIILEAMACGLPVITTNVCGNPEIIQDGYNGLLVEYNDKEQIKNAILKIWRDRELRGKLIKNAKTTVLKFGAEKMINETINALSNNKHK